LGKFSRFPKERSDANGVPGPGSYEPKLLRYKGNKSYSIGSSRRPKQEVNLDFPAPSTYIPLQSQTKKSSQKWRFGDEKQRPDTVKNITVQGLPSQRFNHECRPGRSDINKLQQTHHFYEYDQVNSHTYYPEKPKKYVTKAPFHMDERKPLHHITGTDHMVGPGAYTNK